MFNFQLNVTNVNPITPKHDSFLAGINWKIIEYFITYFFFYRFAVRKALNRQVKKNIQYRKMHELRLAFSEFYLSLILLQNYQNLNFTGFRKILKKHDKVSILTIYKLFKIEKIYPLCNFVVASFYIILRDTSCHKKACFMHMLFCNLPLCRSLFEKLY